MKPLLLFVASIDATSYTNITSASVKLRFTTANLSFSILTLSAFSFKQLSPENPMDRVNTQKDEGDET
ncbi:hypothetical protein [Bacteroides muris (ex Fokt et al. 2023)]|uniref:Uncharacterized protein n=1 Tax=Bacteroides muris (ex Fokt et al. 2023) TaxID=2937417 RepID=A0A9X2NVQ6_9BACE|nr:hypothetical protein [Bacteroides muris (ex Fokt et al. 2023)]MCR6506139.1 hypothetical protein [Bacteroides muris (ex Fokt et al. 2023)]